MKFFAILSRYLNRQLLGNFFMVLFAILGIILMFDSIETLRKISGRDDVTMWFAAQFAVTRVTKTVEIVLPFVMMVAAMITFWRLSKNNEFVIIRSAGVSMFGFLKPLILPRWEYQPNSRKFARLLRALWLQRWQVGKTLPLSSKKPKWAMFSTRRQTTTKSLAYPCSRCAR